MLSRWLFETMVRYETRRNEVHQGRQCFVGGAMSHTSLLQALTGAGTAIGHLRITFSEGVKASMNAGREKSRSAYFISGAAVFGKGMP